ncbi:hypothetical protein ThvES_00007530 [Thiovulum sp. ES]|nr:hypothetical protein ThvES_00007530 [Thiovulum sp. ES]
MEIQNNFKKVFLGFAILGTSFSQLGAYCSMPDCMFSLDKSETCKLEKKIYEVCKKADKVSSLESKVSSLESKVRSLESKVRSLELDLMISK